MSNSTAESSVANRAGLARIRQLTLRPAKVQSSARSDVSDLPNGAYFNETREKEFWNDIERTDECQTSEIQNEELKRTESVSDLQDTSGKIRSLISKFDDIDQETLLSLMQIYDENGGSNDQLDTSIIMSDSKLQVLDLISQLNGLSVSEKNLIETLKFWFNSIQKRSADTGFDLEEIPNVDDVIAGLGKVLEDFNEKSERAVCLHNDIIDFMFKQFSQFKRVLLQKEEEIKKLEKTIKDINEANERRKLKKKLQEQQQQANDDSIKREQFEAQLRINTELKKQIEELKQDLQNSELQRISLSTMNKGDESRTKELLAANADVASLRLENEAITQMYLERISQLNSDIQELQKKNEDLDNKVAEYKEKCRKKEQEKQDLDAQLQKQLHLVSTLQATLQELQQIQPITTESTSESNPNFEEEKHLLMLQHEEKIRELQSQYTNDLRKQLEFQKMQFAREKQEIISAITQPDSKELLEVIQQQCKQQIEDLKNENEAIKQNAVKELASKLAILTRQYEHRIKNINQNHQVELNTLKNSLDYAKKKIEIDFDEKLHIELMKQEKESKSKLDDARRLLRKAEVKCTKLEKENGTLKKAVQDLSKTTGVDASAFIPETQEKKEPAQPSAEGDAKETKGEKEKEESPIQEGLSQEDANRYINMEVNRRIEAMETQMNAKYAMKISVIKEEMENQMNWALEKQKIFYEQEMNRMAETQQKELRENLLKLQDTVNKSNDLSSQENFGNIVTNISTCFTDMNDQLTSVDEKQLVPTVPVAEVTERTKGLTDRIIDLRQKFEELKLSTGDDTVDELKQQLELYKSLSKGDHEKLQQQLEKINEQHRSELAERDKLIQELTELHKKIEHVPFLFDNQEIFDYSPDGHIMQITSVTPLQITPMQTTLTTERSEGESQNLEITKDEVLLHVETVMKKNEDGTEEVVPIPIIQPVKDPEVGQVKKRKFTYVPAIQTLNLIGNRFEYIEKFDPIVIPSSSGGSLPPATIKVDDNPPIEKPKEPEPEKPVVIERTLKKLEETNQPIVIERSQSQQHISVGIQTEIVQTSERKEETRVHVIDGDEPNEEETTVPAQTTAPHNTLDISSSRTVEFKSTPPNVQMTSVVTQEVDMKPPDIAITSQVASFHVSEMPSPKPTALTIVMTFSGEKQEEKVKCDMISQGEIFIQEPQIAVYLSVDDKQFSLDIPLQMALKLEETMNTSVERLEPEIEVLEKAPDYKGRNYHIYNFPVFEGDMKQYIVKNISDSQAFEFVPDTQQDLLKLSFDDIRHKAIEYYEHTLRAYAKEMRLMKEELKNRPNVVLIPDTKLDDLRPPKFSNQKKLTESDLEKMGVPKVDSSNLYPNNSFIIDDLKNEEDQPEEKPAQETARKEEKPEESSSILAPSPSEEKITNDALKLEREASQEVLARTPSSMFLQEITIPGVDINADPFGSSFKIVSVQLRSIKDFTAQDESIVEKIGGDTSAYFAYLSAAGFKDEAHYSFIDSLQATKREHDDLHTQLFYIQSLSMYLTKCLKQMRKKYTQLQQDFDTIKQQQGEEQVKLQEELLHRLQNQEIDPLSSKSMQQLSTMHQLENSISMLTDLGFVKTPEQEETADKLNIQIQANITKLNANTELDQKDVDKLVQDVQKFVGSLNQPCNISPRATDFESCKADCHRLRKERNAIRNKLKEEKLKTESLTVQVENLKSRLSEVKDQSRADATLTQAQLQNLKEAMKATDTANLDDAKEIFKKQMLNMVALLDAANAEKNLLHNKVHDLEDHLNQANDREKKMQAQMTDLLENKLDMQRSNSSTLMFKDADIEHLREQLLADKEVAEQQRLRLEEATAANAQLMLQNSHLEEELFKLKNDMRQMQLKLDDANLTKAINIVKQSSQPKKEEDPVKKVSYADKATQKGLVTESDSSKQIKQTPVKPQSTPNDRQIMDSMLLNSIEKISTPSARQKEEEKKQEAINNLYTAPSIPEITREEEEKAEEEETMPLSTFASKENLLFPSQDGFFRPEADTFSDELIPTQQTKLTEFGENVPHIVHDPLVIKKKAKVKLPVLEQPAKTNRPMKHHFNTTSVIPSLPRPESIDLTLNNAEQGKRQVTGSTRPIKPTKTISDATSAIISASSRKPEGPIQLITSSLKIPPFNPPGSSHSSNQQINQYPAPSKALLEQSLQPQLRQRPIHQSIDRTLEINPPAPVRITLVVPNGQNNSTQKSQNKSSARSATAQKEQKKPTVILPPPPANFGKHPAVLEIKGTQIQQRKQDREVQEAMRVIAKLRERILKLSNQNEQAERIIHQQRQKISELTLQLHRSKLDVIKANDANKRAQIRADNVKTRLEICYNEISSRDDEIIRLKRQLILLKNSTQPINEVGTKIMQARRERERIKRERRQRAEMKNATEKALRSATNEATAKHLTTLLANTENSIARLEAKRRFWKEYEQKQAMAVLGAMSLLSTSEVETVKNVLPEYSPFRSNRLESMKNVQSVQRELYGLNSSENSSYQSFNPPKEPEPTYPEKIAILDKVDPPLTDEERRDVVLRKESPELAKKILNAIRKEQEMNSLNNMKIAPSAQ